MHVEPRLEEVSRDGVHLLEDAAAREGGLLVAFSDRRGGVSEAPYDSLNLSLRSDDDPERVRENRRRAAAAAGFDPAALALARQVHGTRLLHARAGDAGVLGEGDALAAPAPGVVLGILTADCAPVVVAGTAGVALVHAGWRGLVSGVVERGVGAVGAPDAAWVGPCIRACCYEVGDEVTAAFSRRGLPVAGRRRVDPSDAAVAALTSCGVARVAAAEVCTMCSPDYFSYRRDGVTGRQGAFAALLVEDG